MLDPGHEAPAPPVGPSGQPAVVSCPPTGLSDTTPWISWESPATVPAGDDSANSSSVLDVSLEVSSVESSNNGAGVSYSSAAEAAEAARRSIPSADAEEEMLQEFYDGEVIPGALQLTSARRRGSIVRDLDRHCGHLYKLKLGHDLGTSANSAAEEQLLEGSVPGTVANIICRRRARNLGM